MDESQEDGAARFFSVREEGEDKKSVGSNSLNASDSIQGEHRRCLTLRCIQWLFPCAKRRGVWEPSQGNVFKNQDAEEAKYPRTLRILEHRVFDAIFVFSCLASIFLFLFSEGFLMESRLLWGIIHLVNAVYALGLFSQWLQILIKSKYAKTNHGYTTRDIVYTLLSVFPADLIVVAIYTLNEDDDKNKAEDDKDVANPIEHWMITISRLNYFLRFRSIFQYFSKWENHLVVGDFQMFLVRTFLCGTFLLHFFACIWHRLACNSFRLKHFLMTPDEATTEICSPDSWLGILKEQREIPLLHHPDWHVLTTHYLVSIYWTVIAAFRLGASDIKTSLGSNYEIAFVACVEITVWVYVLANVSGMLCSLLVEKETEKEKFLTRCYAIFHYLNVGEIPRTVQDNVMRFYKYLWEKNKGILKLDLMDLMPYAMKSEVYYDVNKFVLDQLPMLKGLDTPFLMSLSVHLNHKFYLTGEILFKKNETASAMFYLLKGHLEILSDDESQVIATIRSGSVIGELHLLQPYPLVSTVRCGTYCDVLMLSRKHFKRVLNAYPQHIPTLEQRLENRLEQSRLLLALCEKHNTYQKAFKALQEYRASLGNVPLHHAEVGRSFENVTKILNTGEYVDVTAQRVSDDFDGLTMSPSMEGGQHRQLNSTDKSAEKKGYEELLVTALTALETDVARAGSLASDLNIPRPPLFVSAPDSSTHGFKQPGDSIFTTLFRKLRESGKKNFLWKFLVSLCALAVFWYYPFQYAFREESHIPFDYVFHVTDVIFALDCFYDMMQVVVTPQKTFESFKEILLYRIKSFYFYIRVLSFIPFEYMFAPFVGSGESLSPYFYLFKFNRLLQIHLVYHFMSDFETHFRLSPIIAAVGKLGLGLFFVAHIFTVIYSHVMRDINENPITYRQGFYWALTVTTSLGYGDFRATTDIEVAVEVFGLMIGVSSLLFLQAKVTSILVNYERRRMTFKQTFYGLQDFMKQRKFPKSLWNRVCSYYRLQWRSHAGTLIPTDKPVIWDAPRPLVREVSYAHAYKYVSRIPIFMKVPFYLQNEFCTALKHYIIHPHEVLLYPNELVRDLYIISKGFVEVIHEGKQVGIFSEGRYFGLNGLIYGVNSKYMFRTLTDCQIFCLSQENFRKVASSNPNFLHECQSISDVEKSEGDAQSFVGADGEKPLEATAELPPYPTRDFIRELKEEGVQSQELPNEDEDKDNLDVSWFITIRKRIFASLKTQFHNSYLLPNSSGLKCWMTFRITAAIFATIFAPAQATFPVPPATSFATMLFFDCIAWIDMIISMRIAYFGEEKQLVTSSSKMAQHYLKGPFVLDLISCFPADIVFYILLSGYPDFKNMYYLVACLRLNRMLQCYKVILINRILERAMFKSLSFIMLLEMMPVMFLFINLTTCLCVIRVCGVSTTGQPVHCDSDAWIIKGLKRLNYMASSSDHEHDIHGLISENTEEDLTVTGLHDFFRSYLVGLYWVSQTVLLVGFGDIEINTGYVNQTVAICTIFFGILGVTYVGGRLTSCMVGEDPAKIELQEKMNLMNDFLEQHRASNNSRRRVRETYLNEWDKTKGVSPSALFLSLPPTLKTDVMKHLYGSTLRSSPMFQTLDGPGLRMLSGLLAEIFYPEGEFLLKFGDLCTDVFFIAHGVVVCYNVRGEIMSQMGGGSLIGEITPIFQTHRLYNAIAVKDVSAYVFKREDFMNFLTLYPRIKAELEACSVKHYKEAMLGTRKPPALMENDVMFALRNEKTVKSVFGVGDDVNLRDVVSNKTIDSKSSRLNVGDVTRNVLKDDLLKNPEDFSKGSNEKWWSVFVTFGRMARDEMGLVHIYQEMKQCTFFNFTVHPASSVCKWVSFCLVLTALSCSITAYEIAFSSGDHGEGATETIYLAVLRYALEVFYVIRFIGNFHLGYYDETSTLITDVKTISRRYMKKIDGMWLDIITTFPFYIITELTGVGVKSEYLRGVQLLRVALFVRYLNETDTTLKMKASRVKVLKITILLCFNFHFWACAWYLVACYESVCTRGSWMDKILNDLEIFNGISPDDVTIASRYLLSLYYVTDTLTCTGFAEITARANTELMLTITMIFGTVFFIGYLVGEMAQCLISQVATKIRFQHQLSVLESHFIVLGISVTKIAEVRHYFKLLWCRCKGVVLYNLMQELPYSLRADVALEIYGPNMKSSRILGKLDENLIRQICARIRHEIYFPGSHIVRAGDVCTSMYFIKKGEVVILDGNTNLEVCVEILYENECFGEVKLLLPREQYRFSYVARLESEVGVLMKEDLEAILRNHPRIFDELKEKAIRVKVRRQSLKEDEPHATNSAGIHTSTSLIASSSL